MLALLAVLPLLASRVNAWANDNHTCAIHPRQYSCENTTTITDTCCVPTEGLVLVTQFWDTYTENDGEGSVLPEDTWTIHGLWPDRCDGTYGQYCDLSRQYDPRPSPKTTNGEDDGTPVPVWKGGDVFTPLLERLGKADLLAFMQTYWISQYSPGWGLWQHEFSKHATCFSTFDVGANGTPNCYSQLYENATEASIVQFLESVVQAYIQYPTYKWLAQAGITPSNSSGYSLDKLQNVLTNTSGAEPYLGCSGPEKNVLSEVWYYSHVLGRPQEGIFKPVHQTTKSNCNTKQDIWYYERSAGSEHKVGLPY